MINVLPINDERQHERTGFCWCNPRVEWQDPDTLEVYGRGPIVVHNAADCREVSERVTGESVAPHLKWETIED